VGGADWVNGYWEGPGEVFYKTPADVGDGGEHMIV